MAVVRRLYAREIRLARLTFPQRHRPGSVVPGPPLQPAEFSWTGFTEATSKEFCAQAILAQAIANTAIHRIDIIGPRTLQS